MAWLSAGTAPGRTDAGPRGLSFPDGWTEIVPELEQSPDDYLVSKQRRGAFLGTTLDETLRGRGVTQVFLTGIATRGGVESTAHSAYDLGYNVVLGVDAMTDMDGGAHRYSVEKTFSRLGETDTTDNVLQMLGRGQA